MGSRFPPTELFSEGWMLRLLLEAASRGEGEPFGRFLPESRWYSEARLASAFLPRFRGDPHGEGYTHADGVVGHFDIRRSTTAGLDLWTNARQFIVIEAKMFSPLALGTSKVPWFDQAARNVAAMAWTLHTSPASLTQFQSLAFIVVAPASQFADEPSFNRFVQREAIQKKVERRVALYGDDAAKQAELDEFMNTTFQRFIDRCSITAVSWEATIRTVRDHHDALDAFYERCLAHNERRTTYP